MVLRGLIDRNRAQGRKFGQFLLLGSASMDLLRQSSESLAGRIRYIDILVDLLLVRRLQPWHTNVKKRLVKSPRFTFAIAAFSTACLASIAMMRCYPIRCWAKAGKVCGSTLTSRLPLTTFASGSLLKFTNATTPGLMFAHQSRVHRVPPVR